MKNPKAPDYADPQALNQLNQDVAESQCSCGNVGTRRIHNNLDAGVHCDNCWGAILYDYGKQSW